MKIRQVSIAIITGLLMFSSPATATDITMKISGEGAINDSTIAVGIPVLIDIYWSNDKERKGFTTGFSITSKTIKKIVHVKDTLGGLNENGDIKGYNGWEDKSKWDLGFWAAMTDWDGVLPDNMYFGGAVIKKRYLPHENMKVLSMEMIIPETGTIVIDSAFSLPAGYWKFGSSEDVPTWDGPHVYKVVKRSAEKADKKTSEKAEDKKAGK